MAKAEEAQEADAKAEASVLGGVMLLETFARSCETDLPSLI